LSQRLVLKSMEGIEIEAELAGPFKADSNEIEFDLLNSGERRKLPLTDICHILFEGRAEIADTGEPDDQIEEVRTCLGDEFIVKTNRKQEFKTGFYGIPIKRDFQYKAIFFTANGTGSRLQKHLLGQILKEKGFVSAQDIDHIIEEQQSLRDRRVGEIIAEYSNLDQGTLDRVIRDAMKKGNGLKRMRVGDILVSSGLVTREQVERALASQEDGRRKKIGTLLIEKGYITEDQLLVALATKFRMRFVDLEKIRPAGQAIDSLSEGIVRQLNVLPIEKNGNNLVVATSEPTDHTLAESLRFNTGCNIELVVATSKQISECLDGYYGKAENRVNLLIDEMNGDEVIQEEEKEDTAVNETDSHIIRLVNSILIHAYNDGASDIHFEPKPGKKPVQVRYRKDGVCRVMHQFAGTFKHAIISRLKIMSNLDIAEKRRPQSGKILLRIEGKKVEYRVEITPTVGGLEDAVLRVLSSAIPLSLEEMGFTPLNLKNFKEIISKPYGMVLCVGPTGSGKTTSLHSALSHLNTPDRKIWTAEDPVEITQDGLRQVQVNSKIGYTFKDALRSFLRADPDIVMIGEMRDSETAKTAIEASLTGHLVFSTLHTNSAPETVVRLMEMGMDPLSFADAFLGILAQRLARRLCGKCSRPYHPEKEEYEELVRAYNPDYFSRHGMPEYSESLTLMKKTGCKGCDGSGYKGRLALHELLIGEESIKVAVKRSTPLEELQVLAIDDGMRTLKMDGIQKIFDGLTDLEQVLKVCN